MLPFCYLTMRRSMSVVTQKMKLETAIFPIEEIRFQIPRRGKINRSKVKTSFSVSPKIEHIAIFTSTNYLPGKVSLGEAGLDIDKNELLQAMNKDFLNDLFSKKFTIEETEKLREQLSSWIEKKIKERDLNLTEDARVSLINIMALIMKKVDQLLKESGG